MDWEPEHGVFERDCFGWLLPGDRRTFDRVETMGELREGVESLPETAQYFTLGRVLDETDALAVVRPMVVMLGSWPMPERFSTSGPQQFINPNNPDRRYFTDAAVECGCGALMVREETTKGDPLFEGEHDHADDCTVADRLRARAELYEKRAEIAEEALRLGLPARRIDRRLGLSTRSNRTIGHLSQRMNLPTQRWKEEANRKRTNTEAVLLALGYEPDAVAAVWGVTPGTIRARISKRTPWTLSGLREARAAAPPDPVATLGYVDRRPRPGREAEA